MNNPGHAKLVDLTLNVLQNGYQRIWKP